MFSLRANGRVRRGLAVWASALVAGCVTVPRSVVVAPLPDRVQTHLVAPSDDSPRSTTVEIQLAAAPPARDGALTLSEALARAMLDNPRLKVYRTAIDRSAGLTEVAFAPFLPQVDVLNRAGVVNSRNGPGAPGIVGGIVPNKIDVPYNFQQIEFQIQWTLYDFGRTSGRYGQAVSREKIATLQYNRARETVAFDAARAYLEGLQTNALRVIQEEAIRQARAILEDTRVRQEAGVLLRDAVLRAEVQLSESREGLVVAQESELAAQARLNNVLGRDASRPVQLAPRDVTPLLGLSLDECLARAGTQRPEVAIVRETVAGATQGREAVAAEFLPRIYLLSGFGAIQGDNVLKGGAAGVGIHLSQPLYHGGKHQGELRAADAEVREALEQASVLLNDITLEVTLAYRHVTTGRQRIELARPAVTQATENLRLVRTRYQNGNATPLDIVDAQTALTRAQQRLVGATYDYQIALARLDYVMGNTPGCLLEAGEPAKPSATLPAPRELPNTLPAPRPVDEKKVERPEQVLPPLR